MRLMIKLINTETRCEICGERFRDHTEIAEMYDPRTDEESVICHLSCGELDDYELA